MSAFHGTTTWLYWTPKDSHGTSASITLHEDVKVSFNNGYHDDPRPHGEWFVNSEEVVTIKFHHKAEEPFREHVFKKIPLTDNWHLETRDGKPLWPQNKAVLMPVASPH